MKIAILILVLVGLLFVIFVVRGALRDEAPPPKGKAISTSAKKQKPPDWTGKIKGLFSSMQPKLQLARCTGDGPCFYSSSAEETVKAVADKKPFRTATFHLLSGSAEISYDDVTPKGNTPLKDMDNPQTCDLPQDPDPDIPDTRRCSILALKNGGKFTFKCKDNSACRVEVE